MLHLICLSLLAGLFSGMVLPSASLARAGRPALPRQTGAETATPATAAGIRFPQPGQALQGSVVILGDVALPGFRRFELQFSYHGDPTGAWFLIAEGNAIPDADILAEWDTGSLTDGVYDLRLVVFRESGEQSYLVSAVRVRNYTPVETSTPTPVTPTATTRPGDTPVPTQTATASVTPLPSPTPTLTALPANPGEISRSDLLRSLGNGALLSAAVFILLGIYWLLRRIGGRA
jgi:hypothetical protein